MTKKEYEKYIKDLENMFLEINKHAVTGLISNQRYARVALESIIKISQRGLGG